MKKIISIICILLANNIMLANDMFKENIKKILGDSIKIKDVVEVKDTNYNIVVLEEKEGNQSFVLSDKNGDIMFNQFIANEEMQKKIQKALEKTKILTKQDKDLIEIVKKIPEEMTIKLQSKNEKSNKVTFLLTDVNCPYCKDEFKTIDERIKNENIIIIFTPVKGIDSLKKSAYILNKIKTLKNDEEKINLLKNAFNDKLIDYEKDKIEQNISVDDVSNIKDLIFGKTNINYVPFLTTITVNIIEDKK